MSTADMLADPGFDVSEAGSAGEATGILRQDAPVDLLVTGHLMPGLSGAELAWAARQLGPGLAVLVVSGYAEVEGLATDLPRPVKPIRIAELAERVGALVPSAPPTGQARRGVPSPTARPGHAGATRHARLGALPDRSGTRTP